MTSRASHWREHFTALVAIFVLALVVAIPFTLRNRSVEDLERQYDETHLGQSQELVLSQVPLQIQTGSPPERYRNDVWRKTDGDRLACRAWGVRHGQFLSANHSLIIGFDAQHRVAFKAIGNT